MEKDNGLDWEDPRFREFALKWLEEKAWNKGFVVGAIIGLLAVLFI